MEEIKGVNSGVNEEGVYTDNGFKNSSEKPPGIVVYEWLRDNHIEIRDREGVPMSDDRLYRYCLEYGKSILNAVMYNGKKVK